MEDDDNIELLLDFIGKQLKVDIQDRIELFKKAKINMIGALVNFSNTDDWESWRKQNLSLGVIGKIEKFLKQRKEKKGKFFFFIFKLICID